MTERETSSEIHDFAISAPGRTVPVALVAE